MPKINKRYYPFASSLKIKQFFKFLVQSNAEDQCQLCGGVGCLYCSMELIVFLDTPIISASCVWDSFFSACFLELFFNFSSSFIP